ncbi:MAG: hypothetical protein A3F77_08190 [Betaproteobacteria bacterium RIFCSPLOWO2_12_FULL_67_28]|nr:MAG: hypothetical protein A3I65_03340 [Betaproteobacteria bacterium RIFCSPLOWO2_02_FULL_68_150]OGA70521.1 MAG: hypothetical protein A3F77_08190 [Betaproteobacteria bacterium RIFCSPLOWO2_12_FULL_67_28]
MKRTIALLVFLAQCAPCGAQELGRLFFSPAQRDALDARRNEKAARAPAAAPVRIDGYVLRSGGRPTLWVNGSVERSNLAAKSGSTLDHAEARDVIEDRQVRLKR